MSLINLLKDETRTFPLSGLSHPNKWILILKYPTRTSWKAIICKLARSFSSLHSASVAFQLQKPNFILYARFYAKHTLHVTFPFVQLSNTSLKKVSDSYIID